MFNIKSVFWNLAKTLVFISFFNEPLGAFESVDREEEPFDVLNFLGIPLVQSYQDNVSTGSRSKEKNQKYQQMQANNSLKGLRNFGNTCYLNAITYLIANTSLHKLVTEDRLNHAEESTKSNPKLKNSLKILLNSIKSNNKDSYHQHILRNYLGEVKKALNGKFDGSIHMQQDAAEFIELLLQALGVEGSEFEMVQREQITYTDDREVIIYDNPYNILQLPLEGHSVNDLAEHYFKKESFKNSDEDNHSVDKFKQVGLVKAPKTLLVQLKRFTPSGKNRSWVSLDRYLNLPFYSAKAKGLSEQVEDKTYRLKALVVHQGISVEFGHYVSYEIKYKKKGTYLLKYDDDHISRVPMSYLASLLTKDAYLLAYERKN